MGTYKAKLASLRRSRTRKAKKAAKRRYEAKKALLPPKPKKETALALTVQRRFLFAIYAFVRVRKYWPTPPEARYVLEAWERAVWPTFKLIDRGIFVRIQQSRRLHKWLKTDRGKPLRVLPLTAGEHYARRRDHPTKVLNPLLEKGELETFGTALRLTPAAYARMEKPPIEARYSTDARTRRFEVQDRTALLAAQRLLCQIPPSSSSPESLPFSPSPDGPTPLPD